MPYPPFATLTDILLTGELRERRSPGFLQLFSFVWTNQGVLWFEDYEAYQQI